MSWRERWRVVCVLVEINVLVGWTSSGNFCSEHDERGCLARCFPTAGTGEGLGGKRLRAFSLIFCFVPVLEVQAILESNPNLPEINVSLSTDLIRPEADTPNLVLVIKNILTFLSDLLNTTILGTTNRYWPIYATWARRSLSGVSAHSSVNDMFRTQHDRGWSEVYYWFLLSHVDGGVGWVKPWRTQTFKEPDEENGLDMAMCLDVVWWSMKDIKDGDSL